MSSLSSRAAPIPWAFVLPFPLLLLPLSVSVAQETRSISLAWDASPDPSVTGYEVHYGFEPGHPIAGIDVGKTLTSTIPNLACEIDYYFVVTAYNAGGLESAPSNEVKAPKQAVSLPQPPRVPQNQPLVVTLTSPTANAEFVLSKPITLEASVTGDNQGDAVGVAFFAGWTKIGEDASKPYSLRWKPQTTGEYLLSARIIRDEGFASVSDPIPVIFRSPEWGKGSGAPVIAKGASRPEKKGSLQAETQTAQDENPEPAGSTNKTVVMEASNDLQAWEPVAVLKDTDENGNVEIADRSKRYPRFYRRVNP